MDVKRCSSCGVRKGVGEFYRPTASWCKGCVKEDAKGRRRQKAMMRLQRITQEIRQRYPGIRCPGAGRFNREEFWVFVAKQEAQCRICGVWLDTVEIRVDFDPRSGAVKGVVCKECLEQMESLRKLERWKFVKELRKYVAIHG